MKRKILSLIMCISVICSLILPMGNPLSAAAASQYEAQTLLSEVSAADWMSAIRGETRLTEITMPGSHDSGAKAFEFPYSAAAFVSKTQDKTIPQQLEAGVRFLDIRLEGKGEGDNYEAFLTHGDATCVYQGSGHSTSGKFYLDYLIQNVMDFLEAHPSETVIICMKKDKGNADITTPVYNYIHGQRSDGYYFYGSGYNYRDHWYLGNGNPTLDEVRGKMVLFNRYNSGATDGGTYIDWPDQGGSGSYESPCYRENYARNGYIQDHYEWSVNNKVNATQEMMNLAHEKGKYYISFSSSTLGETVPNPEGHAGEINPKLKNLSFNYRKPAGIYLMDFATEELCRLFIKNNEAVSNLVTGTDGNISYSINRKTKTITLTGNGSMNNYAYTSSVGPSNFGETAPWGDQPANSLFSGQYNTDIIENIVIGNGITTIGDYAFGNFRNIKSITVPSGITSIGHNTFEYCSSLPSFDLRGTNISVIGAEAFKECTSMSEFYTTANVSSIGVRAFQNDSRLRIYGDWEWYSYTYADNNSIEYIGKYAVYPKAGNTVYETQNPFAGKDLSGGVTISFSQYCNSNKGWDGVMLNFSSGKNNQNRYFSIMADGTILFNDGANGTAYSTNNNCYFDINSSSEVNCIGTKWVDIDITISPSHILKYYADGQLKKEYNLNSIAGGGYPNGISGNNGIFSFLASSDINLYYGASFSIYTSIMGTTESYLDNASFYRGVLSDESLANTESSAVLSTAEFHNSFDNSIPSVRSGNVTHLEGYREHQGVLYIPENTSYGGYETVVNGAVTSDTNSINKLSSITANYTGAKDITGWQTVSTNIKNQSATRTYSSTELNFTLEGYTIVNALLRVPATGYYQMDFEDYDEAYSAARNYLESSEQEYTTDSINALQTVFDSLEFAPINGISHGAYYDNCQDEVDIETAAINNAISRLVPTSDFARLDLAYSGAQRFVASLDGRLPFFTQSSIINLQTAMRHAKKLAELSDEEKLNYHSATAQSEINALALEVETAYAALTQQAEQVDFSAYQSLVESAESIDTDAYEFESNELETILDTLSLALVGDNVYFTDSNGETLTVKTLDDNGLEQDTVDSVCDFLLSSLNEHIRMYTVELCQGNAEIGFNGSGKNAPTSASNKFRATYNSTAVFTAENERTAWYMEYTSSTASRIKQYQGFGEKYAARVLGNVKVYAVSKTDSNYEITILRDYGNPEMTRGVQLVDFVEDSFTLPEAPPVPCYTFEGYYIGKNRVEGELEITRDTTVIAKYTYDNTKDCAITARNTLGGIIYSGTVAYNTKIELSDENAYGWVELIKDGKNTSYRPFYIGNEVSLFAAETTTLQAVTREEWNAYGFSLPCINLKQDDAIVNTGTKTSVLFNAQTVAENRSSILEYGLLVGKSKAQTLDESNLTVENAGNSDAFHIIRAKSTKNVGANQFTIAISSISGDIVYRAYLIYQLPSGEIKTVYSDISNQTI